jgi:hypothetical protein
MAVTAIAPTINLCLVRVPITIRVLTNGADKVNRVQGILRVKRMPTTSKTARIAAAFVPLAIATLLCTGQSFAQAPPSPDAPEVVDYHKLLSLLPDAPTGWTTDEPEGSTSEVGGFTLTNVHRDYKKGSGDNAPTAAISILDSAANPEYASATTAAWNYNSETLEGYSKSITIDGNPGFEAYETERKHGSLWLMVAKRYFVQVELTGQDPKELQQWAKKLDLKKLAEIK